MRCARALDGLDGGRFSSPRARGSWPLRLEATLLVVLGIALDVGATLAFQLVVALDETVWWSFRFPIQNVVLVVATITLPAYGIDGALTAIVLSCGAACVVGEAVVVPAVRSAGARGKVPHRASRFVRLQWLGGLLALTTHRGGASSSPCSPVRESRRAMRHWPSG